MKNKKFLEIVVSLGALALVLPMAIVGEKIFSRAEEVMNPTVDDFVDPVDYENPEVKYLTKPDAIIKGEDKPTVSYPKKVILHYHNDDNECQNRRFYTWTVGIDGIERKPDEATWTPTDMQITLDFTVLTDYLNMPSFSFIIKKAGTWSGQSEDIVVNYSDYVDWMDGDTLTLWTIPGEGNSIEICKTEEETKLPKITTAKFIDFYTIECTCTIDVDENQNPTKYWIPKSYNLYAFDKSYHTMTQASQLSNKDFFLFKSGTPSSNTFQIHFNYAAKLNVQYLIESVFPGYENKPARKIVVSCELLYENARFEQYYTYSGNDLGCTYSKGQTTFKLWSPVSARVQLFLYDRGDPAALGIPGGTDTHDAYEMSYVKGGVWTVTIIGDLKGKYYTYSLTHSAGIVETMDPYAKACGVNGVRGFIYDKDSVDANPDGWNTVPTRWDNVQGYDINSVQDLTIYEAHIRDLTMDETWVSKKGNERGTYNAFVESGTTYTEGNTTVTTGFDHIKELGVKAVQLIPVFDNDNDERKEKMKFNWGYNPLNYNCVEGGYSSDPTNPLARIREYKNLIKEFSETENHTRIIMDVVYNHVSSASSSCFTKCMPKYYFRYDENWAYYDGSGCSNEVKTDSTMMRKYIVDSLCWWATEYKIKGFRFDLMGLIDTWTLRAVKEALYNIDPDIVIYGEGWTSGGYHGKYEMSGDTLINGGAESALVYSQLYASESSKGSVGCFNDSGRNAVKGGNDHGYGTNNAYPGWGFVTKDQNYVGDLSYDVVNMEKGIHTGKGGNPTQCINYVSCHDNYTMWDQLRYCLNSAFQSKSYKRYDGSTRVVDDCPVGSEASINDMCEATITAHAMVMLSNGAAFIQGGEEIYRTKSYNYNKADLAKLREGGAEAYVRPFPEYETWSEDPNVIQASGEVIMGDDVVSHNSYKAPDYVNSFKWDRKIKIGSTSTVDYFSCWKEMIKAHNNKQTVGYVSGEWPESTFNSWGAGTGVTSLPLWARIDSSTGYAFVFANQAGGTVDWSIASGELLFKNKNYSVSAGKVSLSKYGCACFKING